MKKVKRIIEFLRNIVGKCGPSENDNDDNQERHGVTVFEMDRSDFNSSDKIIFDNMSLETNDTR